MSVTFVSAVFVGKNYFDNCHSITNTKDLTLKQMFDISARLVSEQDEISRVETIDWENHSWKYLLLSGDERVTSLLHTKVHVRNFQILYCVLVRYTNFTERIIFLSMFNDISCGSRDNEKECESDAQLVSLYAKSFGLGQRSFLGLGWEKKWYSFSEDSPSGEWDRLQSKWCWHLQKANTQSSDPRVHCPEECLRAKVVENYQYTIAPTRERLKLSRTIISVNQLSLYGAVAQICEEYETFHDRTEQPLVGRQSSSHLCQAWSRQKCFWIVMTVLSKIFFCNYMENELKSYSHQDKLSKYFVDAGFLTTVEVGQSFMTKDTEKFSQFTDSVACREYTLPRDEEASEPKGWIRGNTKLGPVLEVAICCLHGVLRQHLKWPVFSICNKQ